MTSESSPIEVREGLGAASTTRRARLLWALAAIALSVAYAPFAPQIAHAWRFDSYAGHGMFVPLYAAALLWFDRERLAAVPRRAEPAGIPVVLAALALLWMGRRADSLVLQGLSLVLAMAGIVLGAFGHRWLRAAAFPIGFLVLMLPLPREFVARVTLPIQAFHASLSSLVLDAAGVPHVREGIYIRMPAAVLVVAEGCNGLRFLMALVTLAAALAQVSQPGPARKALLVAFAVPLAVLANGVRVSALCLAAYHLGPAAAEGMAHHSIGKTIWLVTLGLLFIGGLSLRRAGTSRPVAR